MKKLKMTVLLGLMAATFAGCGSKGNELPDVPSGPVMTESENTVPVIVTEPTAEPVVEVTPEPATSTDDVTSASDNYEESTERGHGYNHDQIVNLAKERDEILAGPDSIDEINAVHELNKQIAALNSYDFSDMKIACIGDSITYGLGGNTDEYGNPISYVNYLRDILGCEVVNVGLAGSAIGPYGSDACFLYRLDQIPEDTDMIIVFGGVNDYLCGNSVYGTEDENNGKYTQAVKKLFTDIRERFPDQEMFVVLTYSNQLEDDPKTEGIYDFDMWLDVQRSYASEFNFHKIEMYRNGFMNSRVPEIQQTFFYDNVHPNDNGYLVIARYIAAKIVEAYN